MPDTDSTVHKIQPRDDLAQGRDLAAENRRKLASLFPGLVTETAGENGITHAIDVDALRDLVGEVVDDSDPTARREKFGLSWHGKSAARRLALTPSSGTLRPSPGESVDWDTTGNVLIEGDNLEVLKLLQKAYAGKVKVIYIDPPYNTGNDFVYKDDFRDPIRQYQRMIGDVDEAGSRITSNSDSGGRFHTAWLNMIYPRLLLARELLREDGLLFISIDDGEVTQLRFMLDEVFGAEYGVAQLVWKNKYNAGALTKGFRAFTSMFFATRSETSATSPNR
jgi:adenine-specific DNA-methyltransferase